MHGTIIFARRFAIRNVQSKIDALLTQQLTDMQNAGTYKRERLIVSPQGASISAKSGNAEASQVRNFCANNYLGLANHPSVVESGVSYLKSHGAGLSSVRFICGTQDIHRQLEKKIATFHRKDDAILYASCFDANGGIFEALLSEEDAVISDSLNHASIIDGIRLCKAKRFRYANCDMKALESSLQQASDSRIKLIVTDGVFSMDGKIAPLPEICRLADQYDALVMIDECHATGFIGQHGRGTPELHGVESRIDIINSTLGKALGGAMGGYTTASQKIIDLLRQKSRPYLFSNTLAPAVVGISSKALDMVATSDLLRQQLNKNTTSFRRQMKEAGFVVIGDASHPIAPVMVGDARLATQMADEMLKRGIYVVGFSFPVVPKGEARIRVQLSAAHSDEDVNKCVKAFVDVGKQLSII